MPGTGGGTAAGGESATGGGTNPIGTGGRPDPIGTGGGAGVVSGLGGSAGGTASGGDGGFAARPAVPGGDLDAQWAGLPASYGTIVYEWPDPADDARCTGAASATATIDRVYFAQTHVMEPSWPLFLLVADRPALLEVVVTGEGAAPEVRVDGFIDAAPLGSLCLAGPAALHASVPTDVHQRDDRFTVTLPQAWMQPGLSVTVTAGGDERSFSAEDLGLGPAPELNFVHVVMDVLNYNDGLPDVAIPNTMLGDVAGAMPMSRVRFSEFPVRLPLPQLVVSSESDPVPVLLERRPCRGGESPGATCVDRSDVPDGNINAAALRVIDALQNATGEYPFTVYFGNTENFFPGGWGGGRRFVGADFGGVFIHEFGHALSLPHWGQGVYQNTDPGENDYRYPYGGLTDDGGGRGDSWNYYQNIGEFVSPICQIESNATYGQERSDGMQRNHHCAEMRSAGEGPWDGFGDFSALAMFRFQVGADAEAGTVPYARVGDAPYHLSRQNGFPNLVVDESGNRTLERAYQPMEQQNFERFDFKFPQQWDVPVYTVYGTYHPQYSQVNVLYEPLEYDGNLPRVIDPTDPQTFDDLAAAWDGPYDDYFWWAKDLTFRFVYEDGSALHALYPHDGVDRNWETATHPWRWDLLYFAVNIPADRRLTRIELHHRPFCVRHAGMTDEGNIANPDLGITAANFMDGATLVASRDL